MAAAGGRKSKESKNIKVVLRIRPGNEKERSEGQNVNYMEVDQERATIELEKGRGKPYVFNRIFQPGSQQDIYESVASQAVKDAFEGYHGLLFAYGQTGTGKTFTMSNQDGDEGILQRALKQVFARIAEDKAGDYEVRVQFIQIYKEVIHDLLAVTKGGHDEGKGCHLRDDPDCPAQPCLVNVVPVVTEHVYRSGTSASEGIKGAMRIFLKGDGNRKVSKTEMNDVSSRSHTVFTLFINRRSRITEADYTTGESKEELHGRLILVDLAGSERQRKTHAQGERLKEAKSINGSLLVLGKVIKALTEPPQHVPYRESPLTRMLQYSLSGQGKTSIIICVGPGSSNKDESRSAIEFGQRAMTITQNAQIHKEIDYKAAYFKLKAQMDMHADDAYAATIEELKSTHDLELEEKNDAIRELETQIRMLKADGKQGSPTGSSASPRPAGTAPPSGQDGRKVKELQVQLKEMQDLFGTVKKEKEKQNGELKKISKDKKSLLDQVSTLEQDKKKEEMEKFMLAKELWKKLAEKDAKIDQLMRVVSKVYKSDYINGLSDIAPETQEEDHVDPLAGADGLSPGDQVQRLYQCVLKLRDERRSMIDREKEHMAYNMKAKDAIRLQQQKKEEAEAETEEVRRQLKHSDERKLRLEESLKQVQLKIGATRK